MCHPTITHIETVSRWLFQRSGSRDSRALLRFDPCPVSRSSLRLGRLVGKLMNYSYNPPITPFTLVNSCELIKLIKLTHRENHLVVLEVDLARLLQTDPKKIAVLNHIHQGFNQPSNCKIRWNTGPIYTHVSWPWISSSLPWWAHGDLLTWGSPI